MSRLFNCTLIIATESIFIVSLIFFLCCYTLSVFIGTEIQSESVFMRNEIQSAVLFHRAIMTCSFSNWRCAALLSFIAFATLAPRRQSRTRASPTLTKKVTRPLVSPSIVSVFSLSFSSLLRFHIHADLDLGFYRCPNGSSDGSLVQSRISCNKCPSVLSASTLSVACLSVRLLLCEYAMSCSRHTVSSGFIPALPLAKCFVSRMPGPQNW